MIASVFRALLFFCYTRRIYAYISQETNCKREFLGPKAFCLFINWPPKNVGWLPQLFLFCLMSHLFLSHRAAFGLPLLGDTLGYFWAYFRLVIDCTRCTVHQLMMFLTKNTSYCKGLNISESFLQPRLLPAALKISFLAPQPQSACTSRPVVLAHLSTYQAIPLLMPDLLLDGCLNEMSEKVLYRIYL